MAAKISRVLASYGSIAISGRFRTPKKEAFFIGDFILREGPSGIRRPISLQVQLKRMASTGADSATLNEQVPVLKTESKKEEPANVNDTEARDLPVIKLESKDEVKEPPTDQQLSATSTGTVKEEATSTVKAEPEEKKIRVPKVKAAILLSYSGQGYFGLQLQKDGTKTIENDLLKAMLDGGAIDEDGFNRPKSIWFQRAARTDKNVSAARNIISAMVPKNFNVEAVNKHLPTQIRVMDYRRVTKGFDAKNACSGRTYLYMIPTFAFTPLEEKVQEDYRITPEVLEQVRTTLKLYEGCKNYHNFTSRKKAADPSAMRYILSFTASDPFLKDGLEYVVLQVKGQSFMLHQIRKMIGLVVGILRGYATVETMKKCFDMERIDIPMVPGLGLMLGEAHYDQYNKKFGKDGFHEPLIWDNVADKIEQFCQDQIYSVVTKTENEEKSMFQWLTTVPMHTYDSRDYDDKPGGFGFGPIAKANMNVRRANGEDVDGELDEEEQDSDDEVPRKKVKQEN